MSKCSTTPIWIRVLGLERSWIQSMEVRALSLHSLCCIHGDPCCAQPAGRLMAVPLQDLPCPWHWKSSEPPWCDGGTGTQRAVSTTTAQMSPPAAVAGLITVGKSDVSVWPGQGAVAGMRISEPSVLAKQASLALALHAHTIPSGMGTPPSSGGAVSCLAPTVAISSWRNQAWCEQCSLKIPLGGKKKNQ